jgi:hypothetical protein
MRKTTDSTPEDEIDENAIEIPDKATRLISSDIVNRWAQGVSPRQIAKETGWPIGAIYRILTKWTKAVIEETEIVHQPIDASFEKMIDPLLPEQQAKQKIGRVARKPHAMGKYAHIPGGSEDFAIEKQKDIANEDRRKH